MKRVFLLIILVAATKLVMAQTVTLTAAGFVDSNDSTKNYVVLDQPKSNKIDLYKETLTYLNRLYNNPAAVITSVDGESITVNGLTNDIKGDLSFYAYAFYYNITFKFKDGKIRYEPNFTKLMEDPNPSKVREIYLRNTDSAKPVEINAIFLKSKQDNGYWTFKNELQKNITLWANLYLSNLRTALNDTW